MNDKDFSEVLACFKEAGQIKADNKAPDRVFKIGRPGSKPVRTKMHPAPEHAHDAETVSAKASGKKIAPHKDVKNPLGL